MFLGVLSNPEKDTFINLLVNAAEIDGTFSDEEKNQISAYCNEMGITLKERSHYDKDTDSLLTFFSQSSGIAKKAIFMELASLMLANEIDEKEDKFLQKIQNAFGFTDEYRQEVVAWYREISPLYRKGFELVGAVEVAA